MDDEKLKQKDLSAESAVFSKISQIHVFMNNILDNMIYESKEFQYMSKND